VLTAGTTFDISKNCECINMYVHI